MCQEEVVTFDLVFRRLGGHEFGRMGFRSRTSDCLRATDAAT